jgi:hypothetical protein
MRLAKWIFLLAGVLGLLFTVPLLFAENSMGARQAEFYYGFVCLDICWQIMYLFLSSNPIRYRPMMIPAFLAKSSGTIALTWLYLLARVSTQWIVIGALDGIFAVSFAIAYWSTRDHPKVRAASPSARGLGSDSEAFRSSR